MVMESAATDAVGIYHHKGIILFVNLNFPNSVPTPRREFSRTTENYYSLCFMSSTFFIGTDNQFISIVAIWFCDQSNSFSLSKPQI